MPSLPLGLFIAEAHERYKEHAEGTIVKIVFAVAGLMYSAWAMQFPLWVGGVFSFLLILTLASISAWKATTEKAMALADRLRPKLLLSCAPDIENCQKRNKWGPSARMLNWFMVMVETATEKQVDDVRAKLERIEKDGKTLWSGPGGQRLPFSPAGEDGEYSATIRHDEKYHFSVLFIDEDASLLGAASEYGHIGVGSPNIGWPHMPQLKAIFRTSGEYVLTVSVSGKDVVTQKMRLSFYSPMNAADKDASLSRIMPPETTVR